MQLKTHNIPAVHNYYSDMLVSFANFFDNVVFGSDTIKHYQFNIGNKTIQLNYQKLLLVIVVHLTLDEVLLEKLKKEFGEERKLRLSS